MRATFYELRVVAVDGKPDHYAEVVAVREGEPGDLTLVEETETGVTYPLADHRAAVLTCHAKNGVKRREHGALGVERTVRRR